MTAEPVILKFSAVSSLRDGEDATLLHCYDQFCLPADTGNSANSIRSVRSGLACFSNWYSETFHRNCVVRDLFVTPDRVWLFAAHEVSSGSSVATVVRKIAAISKVMRVVCARNRAFVMPELPGLKQLQKMSAKRTSDNPFLDVAVPETVTVAEFRAMRESCEVADWPALPGVSPEQFWQVVLDCHWTYGFRSQDWFSIQTRSVRGLLWNQVSLAESCPIHQLRDLVWPHGWVCFWVRKCNRHLALPLSSRVRSHVDLFRGIDPERVFPIPRSKDQFYSNFLRIKEAAGVDSRITLSGRSSPSLRKACTVFWDSVECGNLTSVVLGHSLGGRGSRSSITDRHYSQLIRRVCDHIENVVF